MSRHVAAGALLIGLASVALSWMSPGSASAHARLKSSSPAKGEVVATSPSRVSITFSQDIQKITGSYGIDVTDESGAAVTAGAAAVQEDNRSILSVALQPNLADGRYVVKYRNVSDADGDPFEAGYAFYVGAPPTAEQLTLDAQLEPSELSATQTFVARSDATSTVTPKRTPAVTVPSVTPVAQPTTGSDDGGSNTTLLLAFGVVGAIVLGGGVLLVLRRRRV